MLCVALIKVKDMGRASAKDRCVICKTVERYYQGTLLKNEHYMDRLYAKLVLKTFKRGEKTACFSADIRETRMYFCPHCGRPIRIYANGKQKVEENDIIDNNGR